MSKVKITRRFKDGRVEEEFIEVNKKSPTKKRKGGKNVESDSEKEEGQETPE